MLTLAGVMSFRGMKIQQFPDIDLPTVIVTANLPGASPAQLETEVARKIENSIATLQGLKHIYTTVQDGTASITAEFRLEKPTQQAVDDVRDAVSRVRSDLPGDLRDPVITKMELAGSPILTYTVASTRMDDEALSWARHRYRARRRSSRRSWGSPRPRRNRCAGAASGRWWWSAGSLSTRRPRCGRCAATMTGRPTEAAVPRKAVR